MAVYYFRNTGDVNWGTATNWSLTDGGPADGAVPTSTDDAYFTANSGNCLLQNTNKVCNQLITTGYTGTITITTIVLTTSSNVTLSSGTTITGTGILSFAGTPTLTCNNATISVSTTRITGGGVMTLADTWTVVDFGFQGSSVTLNGSTLNVTGNLTLTVQPAAGTTQVNLTGTGTWSGNFSIQNPFTINTSGTITLSGTVQVNGGGTRSFTYTSGTIVTTGSTLILNSITLVGNWSSINFNNLTIAGAGTTTTLSSDLNVLGTFGFIGTSTVTLNGVYNINVSGNLTHSSSGVLGGQPTIILKGTGTWSNTSTGSLRLNVNINTSGTITLGSSISYANTTITYTTGTIINTGSTLTLVSTTTLNTSGMTWNNVTISVGTITLNSDLNVGGTLLLSGAVTLTGVGRKVLVGGNFTINAATGVCSALIELNGTGVWSGNNNVNADLTITGNYSISGTVRYFSSANKTLKCTTGTLNTSSGILQLGAGAVITLDTSAVNWNNIDTGTSGNVTINITSALSGNLFNFGNANVTLQGTHGMTFNTITASHSAAKTITLQTGLNYIVNTNLSIVGVSSTPSTITSSSASTRANLKLTYGGSQTVKYVNATRIDSSGGETIYTTFANTLTDTINWGKGEGNMNLVLW